MENTELVSIISILQASMLELKQTNEEAYNRILEKAEEGFFENHQTTGSIKNLAIDILDVSKKQE